MGCLIDLFWKQTLCPAIGMNSELIFYYQYLKLEKITPIVFPRKWPICIYIILKFKERMRRFKSQIYLEKEEPTPE